MSRFKKEKIHGMTVIRNKAIPFQGNKAMNLFGILFAKPNAKLDELTINHERIHTAQIRELLYIFFYLGYVIEWLIRLIQFRNGYMAYRNTSFEQEAYQNQEDTHYLKSRKFFSFLKYVR